MCPFEHVCGPDLYLCLQGGTGQTLLYKEKATGEQVAIKLIKRPIPKVIMPNILREISVRAPTVACSSCGWLPAY